MLRALADGDLEGVARRCFNVFEAALARRPAALVAETKNALLDLGALGACMSGTGSAVFGLFRDRAAASGAAAALKGRGSTCFVCGPTARA